MASEHGGSAPRLEVSSSAIRWPRLALPLATLGVALLLRGSPGLPAVLVGWMFNGLRFELGECRPRGLVVGGEKDRALPGTVHLAWHDIERIELAPTRAFRRWVRVFVRGSAATAGELHLRCTVDQAEAILRAALDAGGTLGGRRRPGARRRVRRGLFESAWGAVLYGGVALGSGRATSSALLAALTFLGFACGGCLLMELRGTPLAGLFASVLRGAGVVTFDDGANGSDRPVEHAGP